MWASTIRVQNVKGFADTGILHLSKQINVFLGANNAGKSTVVRSLGMVQVGLGHHPTDVRVGSAQGQVNIKFADIAEDRNLWRELANQERYACESLDWEAKLAAEGTPITHGVALSNGVHLGVEVIPSVEPKHLIVPFYAKRKVGTLDTGVHREAANQVYPSFQNLIAKVDRIAPEHPEYARFTAACKEILGFAVSTFGAQNSGKRTGILVTSHQQIDCDAMGEGTAHIVALIAAICEARNKIFLIEEIENDIHPKALKGLLALIVESSQQNQFLLTTHSNIVVRQLGVVESTKLFNVEVDYVERIPKSTVSEVPRNEEARRQVLENLGYEPFDFGLWMGWLFLEESSAERIIRDFLIPWFAPSLIGRVQIISCGGTGKVKRKFDHFHSMFLFAHLEPIYKRRAWVVLDGDASGKTVVEELAKTYGSTWSSEHFVSFSKAEFESFYPNRFQSKATIALAEKDDRKRQELKRELLVEVVTWCETTPEEAKAEFGESASEVVTLLQTIAGELDPSLGAPD